jgi:hypothetical protein
VPAMERSLSRSTTAKGVTQTRRSGLHKWAWELEIPQAGYFALRANGASIWPPPIFVIHPPIAQSGRAKVRVTSVWNWAGWSCWR